MQVVLVLYVQGFIGDFCLHLCTVELNGDVFVVLSELKTCTLKFLHQHFRNRNSVLITQDNPQNTSLTCRNGKIAVKIVSHLIKCNSEWKIGLIIKWPNENFFFLKLFSFVLSTPAVFSGVSCQRCLQSEDIHKVFSTARIPYVPLTVCVCASYRLVASCPRSKTANRKCLKALSSTTAPWTEPMEAVWPTWPTWARASLTERMEDSQPWWEQHRSESLLKILTCNVADNLFKFSTKGPLTDTCF